MTAGGHGGKIRDADADRVAGDGPLEQKTESDWIAVRRPHAVSDEKRAIPRPVAKINAGRPSSSLRDIIVPTSRTPVLMWNRFYAPRRA